MNVKKPLPGLQTSDDIFKQCDAIFDDVADILNSADKEKLWPDIDLQQNYSHLLEKNAEQNAETKKETNTEIKAKSGTKPKQKLMSSPLISKVPKQQKHRK